MTVPKKIGITGGIGSGKSVVAKIVRTLGYPVYDSDDRAKVLMQSHPGIRQQLTELFGAEVYKDNLLNRAYLADCIFKNPHAREQVNAIVHPVVRADFAEWANNQQSTIVFQESALLFETGGYRLLDATILVTAPEELRIQRVMERDNTTKEQVIARMAAQLQVAETLNLATFIVENNDNQLLTPQIEEIIKQILKVD